MCSLATAASKVLESHTHTAFSQWPQHWEFLRTQQGMGAERPPRLCGSLLMARSACKLACILALSLVDLSSAGVKGFGLIFGVEPMQGSVGGGTEV